MKTNELFTTHVCTCSDMVSRALCALRSVHPLPQQHLSPWGDGKRENMNYVNSLTCLPTIVNRAGRDTIVKLLFQFFWCLSAVLFSQISYWFLYHQPWVVTRYMFQFIFQYLFSSLFIDISSFVGSLNLKKLCDYGRYYGRIIRVSTFICTSVSQF